MRQSEVLAHFYLHTRGVESIDVVRPRELRARATIVETIFERLGEQPHLHAARKRSQQRVADARVCQSVHREIDLAVLEIDLRNRPHAVIFSGVLMLLTTARSSVKYHAPST